MHGAYARETIVIPVAGLAEATVARFATDSRACIRLAYIGVAGVSLRHIGSTCILRCSIWLSGIYTLSIGSCITW